MLQQEPLSTDEASFLYEAVDAENVAVAGYSMDGLGAVLVPALFITGTADQTVLHDNVRKMFIGNSALSNEELEKFNGGYIYCPGNNTVEVINDKNGDVVKALPLERYDDALFVAVLTGNSPEEIDWPLVKYLREHPQN